ncbi:c-type cytochrome [Maribacter ulvicola]|uniref:Putative heme-binding domain-containing protein n=1 Tax=Maribacter ulvicola TaxID=228959 RepID=A0A1N7AKQ5_9FLAO|nr:c-type cytochrome [Maribacter ulvicola]SIR39573.1 putative heme-binding domain-containing protein [Maribacter ulvicola]
MTTTNQLFTVFLAFSLFACNQENQKSDPISSIEFNTPNDFVLEEIYHPSNSEQGSWVALAQGQNNTIYACDQYGKLYQFKTPKKDKVLSAKDVIPLDVEIGEAHGLLWAFNSLYVAVNKNWDDDIPDNHENGSGIYRITDTDNDGEVDTVKMLLKLEGSGEHGPHSFALSPDGKEIYFIAGNHTLIPESLKENSRIPTNWGEDNLFPPYLDARGHANDIKAPGGWIMKFNADGSNFELISAGFRNPFDMAFNADGELFAYDSDMEWDIGMPWYRPTRICHVTSGSDFGWRTGSGKWPAYYPDNLPAIHNLEQGSPTAVLSTTQLNLPHKYQNGLLVMDWSFGTVYYIDLIPNGSSYKAEREEFLSGTPLPLTDMIAGNDGNIYFATGGRRLDSRVYRLRYTGPENTTASEKNIEVSKERNLRKQLEEYHTTVSGKGTELAWTHLADQDKFIRYASRLVLEHQPVANWLQKYKKETHSRKIIESSIALNHQANTDIQSIILNKLLQIPFNTLDESMKIDLLRTYSLNFIRMGMPANLDKQKIIKKLNPIFPAKESAINKELAQILLYLDTDNIVERLVEQLEYHTEQKTVTEGVEMLSEETTLRSEKYGPLIREVIAKMPPSEAIYYGMLLSNAKNGWNEDLRKRYFLWYFDVLGSKGGMSFKAYMENVRQRSLTHVPENKRDYFQEISGVYSPASAITDVPQPFGPGKKYTGENLRTIVWGGLDNYKGNIKAGKRAFASATCILCHRMRGEGGAAGPDLTQAHTKFSTYDLMFSILSPNDQISDQYANTLFHLQDDNKIAGRVKFETKDSITVMPNPFNESYTVRIAKKSITKKELSPISPMPPALLNRLNEQEVVDLFAYIIAGGAENHELYSNKE